MLMRTFLLAVMPGILGIRSLLTAVIINWKMEAASYSAYSGYFIAAVIINQKTETIPAYFTHAHLGTSRMISLTSWGAGHPRVTIVGAFAKAIA